MVDDISPSVLLLFTILESFLGKVHGLSEQIWNYVNRLKPCRAASCHRTIRVLSHPGHEFALVPGDGAVDVGDNELLSRVQQEYYR